MASPNKRRDSDIMKLMRSGHTVHMADESTASEFYVKLAGPKDSYYEGGFYKHPNVDEASGSVCLDVINQTWSPMFDLVNVFAVFLPQLLLYPNPADPLNRQAAQLLMKDSTAYQQRVREHVRQHASKDFNMAADEQEDEEEGAGEEDEEGGEEMEEGETDGMDGDDDDAEQHADDDEQLCDDDEEEEEVLSECDDMPADEPTEQLELCH